MSRILKIAGVFGIGLFCALYLHVFSDEIFWGWTEGNVRRSMASGDLLISKLYLFRERNGKFPNALTDLVPDYIDSLPLPSAGGKEWDYTVKDGKSFFLWFGMPRDSRWGGYPSCIYNSRSGNWYKDE